MRRDCGNSCPRLPRDGKKARARYHRTRSIRGGSILCIWPRLSRYGRILGSPSRVGTNWLCAIAQVITRFLRRMPVGARERRAEKPNCCAGYVPRIRAAYTRDNTRYYLKARSLFLILRLFLDPFRLPSFPLFIPALAGLLPRPPICSFNRTKITCARSLPFFTAQHNSLPKSVGAALLQS